MIYENDGFYVVQCDGGCGKELGLYDDPCVAEDAAEKDGWTLGLYDDCPECAIKRHIGEKE